MHLSSLPPKILPKMTLKRSFFQIKILVKNIREDKSCQHILEHKSQERVMSSQSRQALPQHFQRATQWQVVDCTIPLQSQLSQISGTLEIPGDVIKYPQVTTLLREAANRKGKYENKQKNEAKRKSRQCSQQKRTPKTLSTILRDK